MTSAPVPEPDPVPNTTRLQSLSKRTVAAVVVGLVVVVGGLLTLLGLLVRSTTQASVQLELVRIGLTVLLGTGGLFGLYLAWRRQRSTEIALQQKERDQADVARAYDLEKSKADNVTHDAEARRITDLYTKAAEQLGSDKAPVRLAGLYALERLAQGHPDQRQTIVNVLCAYLRMPYTMPGEPPADDADITLIDTYRERVQEREVRLTAQRILTHHLRSWADWDNPVETHWADIDIDLTNAVLINLDLTRTSIRTASFGGAQFNGDTWSSEAQFNGDAGFSEAQFNGDAIFDNAGFGGKTVFDRAQFSGDAVFVGGRFGSNVTFDGTRFSSHAWFDGARYSRNTRFDEAQFGGDAGFSGAQFGGDARFSGAQFGRDAKFVGARFSSIVHFSRARFGGHAVFIGAQFSRNLPDEIAPHLPPDHDVASPEHPAADTTNPDSVA